MFKEPTYESYKKATAFARFKYKYGLIVTFAALICFIILILFVWNYGEELSKHPLVYAADKMGVECECVEIGIMKNVWYVNGTTISSEYSGGINGNFRGVEGFRGKLILNNT